MNKSSVNMPENLADGSKTIDSHCAWWHLELERSEDSHNKCEDMLDNTSKDRQTGCILV